MKSLIFKTLLGLLFIIPLSASSLHSIPELSELSKLKAENLKLTAQVLQCRSDLLDTQNKTASQSLNTKQTSLEAEFTKELGCKGKFDWQTLGCIDEKTIK